jgi:hypothetical protein
MAHEYPKQSSAFLKPQLRINQHNPEIFPELPTVREPQATPHAFYGGTTRSQSRAQATTSDTELNTNIIPPPKAAATFISDDALRAARICRYFTFSNAGNCVSNRCPNTLH